MFSLVSTKDLKAHTIEMLLRRAEFYVEQEKTGTEQSIFTHNVEGTVVNLFFEPSTRTNLSFQMAANRLGLRTLDFTVETSSVRKGESVIDSLQTVNALGVDIAIVRHQLDWPALVSKEMFNMALVNAGSGTLEHPTQALLDALTIQQHFGKLRGLTITIVGDVLHSRVARSNATLLQTMGAKVQLAAPAEYKTSDIPGAVWVEFDKAIVETDVIMMLRVQHERHKTISAIANYNDYYGLNQRRLEMLSKDAIILHPGPVNRGVELTDEVLLDSRCKILQQVKNGVAIRMAVLELCLQGGKHEELVSA